MSFVIFNDSEYDYLEKGRLVLFSSDKEHRLLFDYVSDSASENLAKLPRLLEEYVSKKMNLCSLELNDYEYTDADIAEIEKILSSLHPYYKHECREVFINAVGDYLNDHIIHLAHKENRLDRNYDKGWYSRRFKELIAPLLSLKGSQSNKSYNDYLNHSFSRYRYRVGVDTKMPYGVESDGHIASKLEDGCYATRVDFSAGTNTTDNDIVNVDADTTNIDTDIADIDTAIKGANGDDTNSVITNNTDNPNNHNTYDTDAHSVDTHDANSPDTYNTLNADIHDYDADDYRDADGNYIIEETFIIGSTETPARGFDDEIKTQESIKNMLYWILDVSTPHIGELTVDERAWIYGNIPSRNRSRNIKVDKHLLLKPMPVYKKNIAVENKTVGDYEDNDYEDKGYYLYKRYDRYENEYDYSKEADEAVRLQELFHPLGNLDVDNEDFTPDTLNALKNIVDYSKTVSNTKVFEEYEVSSLYQLLYLEILSMIRCKIHIKKCGFCDMYFVSKGKKKKYCSRVKIVNGKHRKCSDLSSQKSDKDRLVKDPYFKIYNRAYKTRHERISRLTHIEGRNREWEKLDMWKTEAKSKLDAVRSRELSVSDFEEWFGVKVPKKE